MKRARWTRRILLGTSSQVKNAINPAASTLPTKGSTLGKGKGGGESTKSSLFVLGGRHPTQNYCL